MDIGSGGIGESEIIGGDIGVTPKQDSGVKAAVSEELVWRARAARAEAQVEELNARLGEIEQELESARTEAGRADQRRALELELALADAVDVDTAAMVAESILAHMDEPDVTSAVAILRRTKPFLFRATSKTSAMSGRVQAGTNGSDLGELADEARDSGDRGALLRYLRARRA